MDYARLFLGPLPQKVDQDPVEEVPANRHRQPVKVRRLHYLLPAEPELILTILFIGAARHIAAVPAILAGRHAEKPEVRVTGGFDHKKPILSDLEIFRKAELMPPYDIPANECANRRSEQT